MSKVIAGGKVRICRASFTRPANTTNYAAGDVVADSTSAPTVMTFQGAGGQKWGSGIIQSALLIDDHAPTTAIDGELFLFDTAPANYGNDNAAFTPTTDELTTLVGIVSFATGDSVAGDASNNALIQATNVALPFKCAGSSDLYGVLVARNAYTPGNGTDIAIQLNILQD